MVFTPPPLPALHSPLENTGTIKHSFRYFSSASPHNGININVYGNELFFEEGHLFIFDSLM